MRLIIAILTLSLFPLALGSSLYCPCKVVKVMNDDTVHVLDQGNTLQKIRLGGIDAPESKQPFGRKSRENLADYVAGELIKVECDNVDRYGRIIGKLIRDGRDINLQQVRDGFAWHYKYYQRDQSPSDRRLYREAETHAITKGKGLWAENSIPPWYWRKGQRTVSASNQTAKFECGSKRYCKDMTSCEEAMFYYRKCGLSRLDGDNDGVPCEAIRRQKT